MRNIRRKKLKTATLTLVPLLMLFAFQNCGESFAPLEELSYPQANLKVEVAAANINVYEGEAVALPVLAQSTDDVELKYKWIKNNEEIDGERGDSLQILNAKSSDAGLYQVEILTTNKSAKRKQTTRTSETIEVVVRPKPSNGFAPTIRNARTELALESGRLGILYVEVDGYPKPSIQWMKDGVPVPGANLTALKIEANRDSDLSVYTARASNEFGIAESEPMLVAIDKVAVPPKVIDELKPVRIAVGSPISLRAPTVGIPKPQVRWYRDGVLLPNQSRTAVRIENARPEDSGTYKIVASNNSGETETFAKVTVVESIRQTLALKDRTVAIGMPLNLEAEFVGDIEKIEWLKDGNIIPGLTTLKFSVPATTSSHSGRYTIRVSNIAGIAESTANVVIVTVPDFVNGLLSTDVNETEPINLSVSARGIGLVYSWFKDDQLIPGANLPTLSIPFASFLNIARYRVRVTNIAGSAESMADVNVRLELDGERLYVRDCLACHGQIELSTKLGKTSAQIIGALDNVAPMSSKFKVNGLNRLRNDQIAEISNALKIDPPTILTHPKMRLGAIGSRAVFSVEAIGRQLRYQWFKDGQKIEGESKATLEITSVSNSDSTNYHVEVSNIAGVAVSNQVNLVVPRLFFENNSYIFRGFTGNPIALPDFNPENFDVRFHVAPGSLFGFTVAVSSNTCYFFGERLVAKVSCVGSALRLVQQQGTSAPVFTDGESLFVFFQEATNSILKVSPAGVNFATLNAIGESNYWKDSSRVYYIENFAGQFKLQAVPNADTSSFESFSNARFFGKDNKQAYYETQSIALDPRTTKVRGFYIYDDTKVFTTYLTRTPIHLPNLVGKNVRFMAYPKYAFDEKTVYHDKTEVPGADALTMRALTGGNQTNVEAWYFAVDRNRAYYLAHPIEGSDPNTFAIRGNAASTQAEDVNATYLCDSTKEACSRTPKN